MKSVSLSDRDVKIMQHLSSGCSSMEDIANRYFPRNDGTGAHSKYVYKWIVVFEKAGLIATKRFPKHISPIVALTRLGAICISQRLGLIPENVRTGFPKAAELVHDLAVARSARRIIEDCQQGVGITLVGLFTEPYLRRDYAFQPLRRVKKGEVFFPDYQVWMSQNSKEVVLDVEIDGNSMSRARLLRKIRHLENEILLLVPTFERLKQAYNYLDTGGKYSDILVKRIYLLEWQSFFNDGLRCEHSLDFGRRRRSVLPWINNSS
ncbi:MAG TPA: hypothetical protein VLH56_04400 [Dissulfurispiraceae bacterium]|nr:hypothetical protein [Dissulfurispiraceae bacterium]